MQQRLHISKTAQIYINSRKESIYDFIDSDKLDCNTCKFYERNILIPDYPLNFEFNLSKIYAVFKDVSGFNNLQHKKFLPSAAFTHTIIPQTPI